jgi:hypothetical protein
VRREYARGADDRQVGERSKRRQFQMIEVEVVVQREVACQSELPQNDRYRFGSSREQ